MVRNVDTVNATSATAPGYSMRAVVGAESLDCDRDHRSTGVELFVKQPPHPDLIRTSHTKER